MYTEATSAQKSGSDGDVLILDSTKLLIDGEKGEPKAKRLRTGIDGNASLLIPTKTSRQKKETTNCEPNLIGPKIKRVKSGVKGKVVGLIGKNSKKTTDVLIKTELSPIDFKDIDDKSLNLIERDSIKVINSDYRVVGDSIEANFKSKYDFLPENHPVIHYLNELAEKMFPGKGITCLVNDTDLTVGAFYITNNKFVLTRGLLDFIESEDELALIFSHEYCHFEEKDLERANRFIEDINKNGADEDKLLFHFGSLRYSEYRADIKGSTIGGGRMIPPQAGRNLFNRLSKLEKSLSTPTGIEHGKSIDRAINLGVACKIYDYEASKHDLSPKPDVINDYLKTTSSEKLSLIVENVFLDDEKLNSLLKNKGILELINDITVVSKLNEDKCDKKLLEKVMRSSFSNLEAYKQHIVDKLCLNLKNEIKKRLAGKGINVNFGLLFEFILKSYKAINFDDPVLSEKYGENLSLYDSTEDLLVDIDCLRRAIECCGLFYLNTEGIEEFKEEVIKVAAEQGLCDNEKDDLEIDKLIKFAKESSATFSDICSKRSAHVLKGEQSGNCIFQESLLTIEGSDPHKVTKIANLLKRLNSEGYQFDLMGIVRSLKKYQHLNLNNRDLEKIINLCVQSLDSQKNGVIAKFYLDFALSNMTGYDEEADKKALRNQALAKGKDIVKYIDTEKDLFEWIKYSSSFFGSDIGIATGNETNNHLNMVFSAVVNGYLKKVNGNPNDLKRIIAKAIEVQTTLKRNTGFHLSKFIDSLKADISEDLKKDEPSFDVLTMSFGLDKIYDDINSDSSFAAAIWEGKEKSCKKDAFSDSFQHFLIETLNTYFVELINNFEVLGQSGVIKKLKLLQTKLGKRGNILSDNKNWDKTKQLDFLLKLLDRDYSTIDKEGIDDLISVVMLHTDPVLRFNLLKNILNKVKGLSKQDRYHYLFKDLRSKNIVSNEDREAYIEKESLSHKEVNGIISDLENSISEDEQGENIGIAVLYEQLDKYIGGKLDLFKYLMTTGESDEELKSLVYRKILYNVDEKGLPFALAKAESMIDSLFASPTSIKFAILKQVLLGTDGLLNTRSGREALVSVLEKSVLEKPTVNEVALHKELVKVIKVFMNSAETDRLFLYVAPVLMNFILKNPKDRYRMGQFLARFKSEKYDENERKAIYNKYLVIAKGNTDDSISKSIRARKRLTEIVGVEANKEDSKKMSASSFILEAARHMGAPAIRFLQVLGQFIDIPDSLGKLFEDVYDNVNGQSKLTAVTTASREWPEMDKEIVAFQERLAGGSMVSVYKVLNTEGKYEVLKVLNPNALMHAKGTIEDLRRTILALMKTDHAKYSPALSALNKIEKWIIQDLNYSDFLEKDKRFREANTGGLIYVPESKGVGHDTDGKPLDNYYVKREEFCDGTSLHRLSGEDKDNIKDYIDAIQLSYLGQINDGLVHSDVHPGNFMVMKKADGSKCVAILDRNNFIEVSDADRAFIEVLLTNRDNKPAIATALCDYLASFDIDLNEAAKKDINKIVCEAESFSKAYNLVIRRLLEDGIEEPLKISLFFKNLNGLKRFNSLIK